jgi:NADH dehydrogenase
MQKHSIVIVGGGFGGLATLHELQRQGTSDIQITLVNPANFTLFTPMLPEVASGSIEARHIVQPLRSADSATKADRPSTAFELGEVVTADLEGRSISVRHPVTHDVKALEYDELVLAVGATDSTMGVSGVKEYAIPLKTIADAQILRERVVAALEVATRTPDPVERDRLLRFAIVGGNFTGVELAGELQAFLEKVIHYYPGISLSQIELVVLDSGEHLLGHLPSKFGKYAASVLRKRGAKLLLKQDVGAIDAAGLILKDGTRISSATVIWAAGEQPSALAGALGLKTSKHGAIEVAADMSVPGAAHVWALGDCAAIPRPHGGTYAPLAQNAIREGALLARNIVASIEGKPTSNFRYRERGQMASLGNRKAVALLPGGHMITGMAAWLAWRAYYLGRLPSLQLKTRVSIDWALGTLFRSGASRLPMVDRDATSFDSYLPAKETHAADR